MQIVLHFGRRIAGQYQFHRGSSQLEMKPAKTDEGLDPEGDKVIKPDLLYAAITAGIFVICAVLFPMMICGCHFRAIAVLPTIAPWIWTIWLLRSYRTLPERISSWLAFVGACGWLWNGFEGNLKFMFT